MVPHLVSKVDEDKRECFHEPALSSAGNSSSSYTHDGVSVLKVRGIILRWTILRKINGNVTFTLAIFLKDVDIHSIFITSHVYT